MPGFNNGVMYADNVQFNGDKSPASVTTNGQLLIGNSGTPHIRVGTLTSPGSTVTIGYSAPNITVDVSGSAVVQTLTPDSGVALAPTAGTIPVLGYKAGTVPVMETYNQGPGNFRIENRVWDTQYVVDSSVTPGLQGTFATIQDAIDQAVIDGMSFSNPKRIYIRANNGVTYTEDLTIQPGTYLAGEAFVISPSTGVTFPTITGNHNIVNVTDVYLDGLVFINADPTADTFTNAGLTIFYARNTVFSVTSGTGLHFTGAGLVKCTNCLFNQTAFQTGIESVNFTDMSFSNCSFNICGFLLTDSTLTANFCDSFGPMVCSSSGISATSCTFFTGNTSNISGTGTASHLYECTFVSNSSTPEAIDYSGQVFARNCSTVGNLTGPLDLYSTATPMYLDSDLAGSVYLGRRVAGDITVGPGDFYLGVTDTTSARTVTLPTNLTRDRVFIIKDESGAAATHNISVTVNGVKTIDGATTKTISTNYGSMQVIYNGTNYFTI